VLQVALLGKLHASTDFSLFGKVGLARWAYGLSTPSFSGSDDDVNVYFGVGADYHISGRSAVRFGADFYNMKPSIPISSTPAEENIYALVYRLLITALRQPKDRTWIFLWTYEFLFHQTIQQYRFANASVLT